MLTRRYALYIIATGLAMLGAGLVLMLTLPVLLTLLILFNGSIVTVGGIVLYLFSGEAL